MNKQITIDADRCTGCGRCVEVCPEGAIYLIEGQAVVDLPLCRLCSECVGVCPQEAISMVVSESDSAQASDQAVAIQPGQVMEVRAQPVSVPLRARVIPLVGAVITWAGREIIPRLADYLIDGLDRRREPRVQSRTASDSLDERNLGRGQGSAGRRHRRRRGGRT